MLKWLKRNGCPWHLDTFDKDIFDDEQSWNDDTIVNIIRFMQASKYVSFFEL